MDNFNYTTYNDSFDSSLVDEAYLNENTGELLIDLSDSLYLYKGVTRGAFDALVNAHSAGEYYNKVIKPTYGPAGQVGVYGDVAYTVVAKHSAASAVGTPKGLTYASDAKVDDNTTNTTFPLKVVAENEGRIHTVVFEANGHTKSHAMLAGSVDEAVAAIRDLASALGVEFKVKQVVVNFE